MPSPLAPHDLLLSPGLAPDQVAAILSPHGLRDPRRADENLQAMATDPTARTLLAEIADELLRCVSIAADPDQALSLFERVSAASLGRRELFAYLKQAPRTLELLARVFGASPFMAEILIRHPIYLYWVTDPAVLGTRRPRRSIERELASTLASLRTEEKRLDQLRVFKRRELLHIGVRDILRLSTVEETLASLSDLAEVLIEAAYRLCDNAMRGARRRRAGYAVIGLGKLGGRELNFSSDVDLLYVYDSDEGPLPGTDLAKPDYYERLSRHLTAALGSATNEGYVYRVDLRLRPEGSAGSLAHSIAHLQRYYASRGRTWERLALLKAGPVAGDRRLGARFQAAVSSFIYGTPFGPDAFADVRSLKSKMDREVSRRGESRTNVKLGIGGIREIEFVAQALQARSAGEVATLRQRATLGALTALREAGSIPAAEHDVLAAAYVFLRDVENKLQMVSDAQVHALPTDPFVLRGLARTLGYSEGDGHDPGRALQADHARHTGAVHEIFDRVFAP